MITWKLVIKLVWTSTIGCGMWKLVTRCGLWLWALDRGHLTPQHLYLAVVIQNILNHYEVVIKALDSLGLIERHLPTHIQKWETCENWLPGAGVVYKPWTIWYECQPNIWQWWLWTPPMAVVLLWKHLAALDVLQNTHLCIYGHGKHVETSYQVWCVSLGPFRHTTPQHLAMVIQNTSNGCGAVMKALGSSRHVAEHSSIHIWSLVTMWN